MLMSSSLRFTKRVEIAAEELKPMPALNQINFGGDVWKGKIEAG